MKEKKKAGFSARLLAGILALVMLLGAVAGVVAIFV